MTTKLIGAAERSSVQDRLRSLPQLRQASATLSGRGAGPGPARPLHPESVKPWRRPRWPGPGRDRPHPVQRAQPAGRVRHQRPPARRFRPRHCPPDPAPLAGYPRRLRPCAHRLGRQRRHPARAVGVNVQGFQSPSPAGPDAHNCFHPGRPYAREPIAAHGAVRSPAGAGLGPGPAPPICAYLQSQRTIRDRFPLAWVREQGSQPRCPL